MRTAVFEVPIGKDKPEDKDGDAVFWPKVTKPRDNLLPYWEQFDLPKPAWAKALEEKRASEIEST